MTPDGIDLGDLDLCAEGDQRGAWEVPVWFDDRLGAQLARWTPRVELEESLRRVRSVEVVGGPVRVVAA